MSAPESQGPPAAPAPAAPVTTTPPDGDQQTTTSRSRRRKIIALIVVLVLLLALGGIAAWYLTTRKPLSNLPGIVQEKPHYLFSMYGTAAPLGVAASPDGDRIYVTQSGGSRQVLVFDRAGKKIGALVPPAATGASHSPVYVAVNPVSREVYVSDRMTGAIYVYDADGRYLHPLAPKGKVGPWAPLGLAFDSTGALYVTDVNSAPHRVLVFAPDGVLLRELRPPAPGQLTFPNGIAVDSKARIAVADSNNGRVVVFDAQGKVLANLAGSFGGSQLGLPRGLATDDSGRLYLVDTTNHRVAIFRQGTNGAVLTYVESFGAQGSADGLFQYPNGVATDSRARIYITDRVNNRVQVWSY